MLGEDNAVKGARAFAVDVIGHDGAALVIPMPEFAIFVGDVPAPATGAEVITHFDDLHFGFNTFDSNGIGDRNPAIGVDTYGIRAVAEGNGAVDCVNMDRVSGDGLGRVSHGC